METNLKNEVPNLENPTLHTNSAEEIEKHSISSPNNNYSENSAKSQISSNTNSEIPIVITIILFA